MRAIVQRVSSATVSVDGAIVGRCGAGFVLLVGVHKDDSRAIAAKLADKVAGLRVFNDGDGKMNLALDSLPASDESNILAISNFTVYGDTGKSRRPSFMESAGFEHGKEMFEAFVAELRAQGLRVETGEFGAHMDVNLTNDGPVTLIVEA